MTKNREVFFQESRIPFASYEPSLFGDSTSDSPDIRGQVANNVTRIRHFSTHAAGTTVVQAFPFNLTGMFPVRLIPHTVLPQIPSLAADVDHRNDAFLFDGDRHAIATRFSVKDVFGSLVDASMCQPWARRSFPVELPHERCFVLGVRTVDTPSWSLTFSPSLFFFQSSTKFNNEDERRARELQSVRRGHEPPG